MIQIRPIEEKDLPFLWDMLYEMVFIPENKPPKEEILSIPDIRKCLEGWGRKGDQGFIAVDEQHRPVGTAWYRIFDESNSTYGFIDENTPELSIAVLPSYMGKGIGTMLLERLIEQAKSEGYKGMSLSADPNNASAVHLYQKLGFEKCGIAGTSWTMILKFEQE